VGAPALKDSSVAENALRKPGGVVGSRELKRRGKKKEGEDKKELDSYQTSGGKRKKSKSGKTNAGGRRGTA